MESEAWKLDDGTVFLGFEKRKPVVRCNTTG